MAGARSHPNEDRSFSEEAFYLGEFAGRTMALSVPDPQTWTHPELHRVLARLEHNRTRVVLIVDARIDVRDRSWPIVPPSSTRLAGRIWRATRDHAFAVVPAEADVASTTLQVGARLGLFKVVLLREVGGVRSADGEKQSFVHVSDLGEVRARSPQGGAMSRVLAEVEGLIVAGVPNVNLCTVEGLGDELFTYSGSGTLFTRDRYVHVRRFGIEDFDAADHLIARGVGEGYLAPRSDDKIDALMAEGFGAFVGGVHLAGIGALRVDTEGTCGEVASLYTLTRFAGGGIGRNLVRFAIRRAQEQGLGYVYGCTTFERVGTFFERQGFVRVGVDDVSPEKWHGYDQARKARIRCYRFDLPR